MRMHETTSRRASTAGRRATGVLPPAQARSLPLRTFSVRCIGCGRRFEVVCAPAACPRCGGISLAG